MGGTAYLQEVQGTKKMKIARQVLGMIEGVTEDTEARAESVRVFNLLWKKFKSCVLRGDRDLVASVYISAACEEPLSVVGNKHVEVALDAEEMDAPVRVVADGFDSSIMTIRQLALGYLREQI